MKLYKNSKKGKIWGVCAGLGEYFDIDPAFVRLAFIVGLFVSFGLALFLYIILAIALDEKK